MSSRRLVNRARANEGSSPQQRPRHRASEVAQEPTPLPPYEPPTCALTPAAQCALETLRTDHDYTKYKRHLDSCIKTITNSIGDSNDRLRIRKEEAARAASKQRQGEEGEEKSEEDKEREIALAGMETNTVSLTNKAEKALRDLISYGDELAMKDTFMREVKENIAVAPPPRPAIRRRRSQGSNEDGDAENEENEVEEDEPEPDGSVVSAFELLKKAQENYATAYASKSMRARYETNDYKGFKRTVHISRYGNDVPVPHARTWFPEDDDGDAAESNARRNSNDDENSDDEIVIARATTNLKCPLTLQTFQEPYSNDKCNHVFEKAAILEILRADGTVYAESSQRRGARAGGVKQVQCPQTGCAVMLQHDDFHLDAVLIRQIKQAARQAARDLEDDDDDMPAPRRTQNPPADVQGGGDSMEVDQDQPQGTASVKREHR